MQNTDALNLATKTITLDAQSQPVLNQALRIAIYDEYRAYEFYKAVISTFGSQAPFSNILQAEMRHFEALKELALKYGVEPPVNDLQGSIKAPKSLQEAYELGVSAEIANIQMYDYLIPYVSDYPDVVDVFYRLQAASYNNHLPVFRSHVANSGANAEALMEKINNLSGMASKIASGNIDPNELTSLLGSANLSLLGGLLAGGVGGLALNQFLQKDEEE